MKVDLLSEDNPDDADARDEMIETQPEIGRWLQDFYRMRSGQTPQCDQTPEWKEAQAAAAAAYERTMVALQMQQLQLLKRLQLPWTG